MVRSTTIALRVSQEEKLRISELAERLQRSRSDAIRFLVLNALLRLEALERSKRHEPILVDDFGEDIIC